MERTAAFFKDLRLCPQLHHVLRHYHEIWTQAEETLAATSKEIKESEKVREMIQWMERELDELNYQLSTAQEQLDEERTITNAAIELINELAEKHGEDARTIQRRFAEKINR